MAGSTLHPERGKTYYVDLNTKAITQPDSRSSPSPGAIRNVPDTVKKALTNGSTGKKYDLSFHVNPSYPEGDFDGDGKMDAAVLVKERSTGKLGIAIVHGTTGLRMDGFLAGLLQNARRPTAPWRRTSGREKRSRQRIDLLEW